MATVIAGPAHVSLDCSRQHMGQENLMLPMRLSSKARTSGSDTGPITPAAGRSPGPFARDTAAGIYF
jgi:hypothetical protein